ncbi:MAG: hypothetical protein H6659_13150 [Ardenticatenaceae bacterium]|nr:hypothetical protein [Ardenticatenaceae bacterium]
MTALNHLNQLPLTAFPELFHELTPPAMLQMHGRFRAEFVGPAWLRRVAPPGLAPLGLGGWWGKTFDGRGQGMNIVHRHGQLAEVIPIQLKEAASLVDGRSGLNITYPPGTRFPWPLIIDEVRWLDDATLLGLTLVTKAGLHRLALPFLLKRD